MSIFLLYHYLNTNLLDRLLSECFIPLYYFLTLLFLCLSNDVYFNIFNYLFTLGHTKARLFITHGGQNSLLQAVYHAVPVLAIPLFGDQFDNVVRAETKGLGLTLKPTQITRELLNSTIQTLLHDIRCVEVQLKTLFI